ncbi:hypothetical protein BJ997_003977 [Cryobacterium roopkundense]|uniref:Uncharacterized protein n=1 Tax=Cryobacterium roopkundense TaxID=1001240 RepID=A0A7W9A057_9MICO|nr:hypothetical protein [Cryobacterium roopkundense]
MDAASKLEENVTTGAICAVSGERDEVVYVPLVTA